MIVSPYLVRRHGIGMLQHRGNTRLAKQAQVFDGVFAKFLLERFVADGSPQI